MTVLAGYVKFIFKILDFYNVKPLTYAKLVNLATTRNFFLDRHTYLFICICIIDV